MKEKENNNEDRKGGGGKKRVRGRWREVERKRRREMQGAKKTEGRDREEGA